jgi:hypothetical protein
MVVKSMNTISSMLQHSPIACCLGGNKMLDIEGLFFGPIHFHKTSQRHNNVYT